MAQWIRNEAVKPWEKEETDVMTEFTSSYSLIVWNDEVNTFEWVIETLIQICGHTPEQAEQCAMLIHTQGKYAVKNGEYETLKPMCDAITDRGIGATIEENAG
jgi:ATP-dependent Clp protease adaptor protein ClpS